MKALVLVLGAAMLMPAVAYAQEAPASDAVTETGIPDHVEKAGSQPEAVGDPTQHFNFFGFSYRGKDEFGGPLGDGKMEEKDAKGRVIGTTSEEEPMSPPFILMLVNFGVLLLILGKYGGPPARKLVQERHDEIKLALEEAAKLRKQAADKLAEYETRLKDADAQIKKLADDMRADAEADKVRILAAAEALAVQVKKEAEQRIASEIELARAQLTREVTLAATAASSKLLVEKATSADQQKLVAAFITDVQARKEAR
jgi:F0F1-type ATP synthase membrane subunit b/b'